MTHSIPLEKLLQHHFPKLPHQDEFILNLSNNNYSPETVYNYNRDLTFFAIFLSEKNQKFENITKSTITYYKGWLKDRKHIQYFNDIKKITAFDDNALSPDIHDKSTNVAKEGIKQSTQIREDAKSRGINPNYKGGFVKNNNPKELGASSINRVLVSLRNYLRFLIEFDYSTPLAPDAVKLIRQPKKKPQVPTLDEVVSLIEAPTQLEANEIVGLRNRAVLETLLATGMRISEVVSLNRDQINKDGKMFITGKGRKQRLVYLTPRAMEHILKYLETRKDPFPALFVPTSGRGLKTDDPRLSANYIQMKIAGYRRILGIVVPISAHTVRHAFATYLAEKGANPAAIQVLLGHESLQTTTRYVHASDKFAEQTHRKYHPVMED